MSEDINNLKIDVAVITNKLDNLDTKTEEIHGMLKQHIIDEENRYREIMDKKADRWVEDALKWGIVAVLGFVITTVLTVIFKQ